MKKIKRFKIKLYSRISGNLKPLNFNKKFPINVKRIFFIYGKKNKIRGEHAHKKCYQFFIPISGKMILNIQTPNSKKKIKLEDMSKTAILVPPKYWCSIKFIRKNSILMVACNRYYEPNDYIENFDVYKKYLSKK
jgi:dTDP-4-dehydrorhamnose 3,5-epimerase-like enzyme